MVDNFQVSDINSKLDFFNDLSPGRNLSASTRIAALTQLGVLEHTVCITDRKSHLNHESAGGLFPYSAR